MKKMRLGIINSNYVKIGPFTKKGTEIFSYILTTNLAKRYKNEIDITSFCSGNSALPVKKESVAYYSSLENKYVGEKHAYQFEMALFSKVVQMQQNFDILHLSNAVGENFLPFARFINKPIVVTLHGPAEPDFMSRYFSLFCDVKNIHYAAISNSQKKYSLFSKARTIYHGIDTKKTFTFNAQGGKSIIWTGRAVPEKGLDEVLLISKKLNIPTKVFPIIKSEYFDWLYREVLQRRDVVNQISRIRIDFNTVRNKLVKEYKDSKVFLFPLQWEEPFGLTIIESMACGTPVITYARGAMSELVKDGETGYLVNPSDTDIRGDYITKKTGTEGMCEAVQRLYSLSEAEYLLMREKSRTHAEKNFNIDDMADNYVAYYKEILGG
ncbi:MAG: glycosyltransferase [bacterium]